MGLGAQGWVGLDANDLRRLARVSAQPEASAAAKIHDRPPCPRSDLPHGHEQVPGPVECLVLQLVATWLAPDVGREPPVRELGASIRHSDIFLRAEST